MVVAAKNCLFSSLFVDLLHLLNLNMLFSAAKKEKEELILRECPHDNWHGRGSEAQRRVYSECLGAAVNLSQGHLFQLPVPIFGRVAPFVLLSLNPISLAITHKAF